MGEYSWEDYKQEYYYDDDGSEPEEPFDANDHLHLDVETIGDVVEECAGAAKLLTENRNENTVFINKNLDEDAFFSDEQGNATIVNRYDLEKSVPEANKSPFHEVDRYWVNKPYAFVIIFHSEKENEKKYYLIEPYLTSIERDLREFLSGKLKTAIKYSSDEVVVQGNDEIRADVINRETRNLLDRYNLYNTSFSSGGGGSWTVSNKSSVEAMTTITFRALSPGSPPVQSPSFSTKTVRRSLNIRFRSYSVF